MDREKLWDNIRQGFKEGVQFTVQKTEELTRIGRLRLDILSQKRKIDRKFSELGGLVYESLREEDREKMEIEAAVQSVVNDLRELEQRLKDLEADLEATNSKPMADEDGEDVDGEVVYIAHIKDEEDEKGEKKDS